jgi:hypothetical protein
MMGHVPPTMPASRRMFVSKAAAIVPGAPFPRCRPWRATRRPVVRGRHRARTDFRSGGGVCVPEPAEKICKGIRHAVKPFEGGGGLGGVLVESRCDRRAAAATKSLSAVLESLRKRMHPQVSREDTRHSESTPASPPCRRRSCRLYLPDCHRPLP